VSFLVGELPKLDLPADSFDVVFIHYTLHEVAHGVRGTYVAELSRLLAEGGKLFIKEPTGYLDGIAEARLRALMAEAGLRELSFVPGRVCRGVYTR
jgi:ubiquinone/menaquinone biosynthesis C-methylase UbiE